MRRIMSNLAATLGSSNNDSFASPPHSSTAPPPPPPLVSPPPYKDNAGSSPPPSLPPPSLRWRPSSPAPESPPPASSPPSSSKYSPPPNPPTSTPPSNTQAPKRSPPPVISTSPPPNSTQKSPPPTPTSSSNAPPPTPTIPIPIPAPPPPNQASPPPPPPLTPSSSPPIPITISPLGPLTTPSPPILNAPTTPSNSPPFFPWNPLLVSPPPAGRAPSSNTSKPSPKTTYNSNVSRNSTGHASNGSTSTVNSTHVIIGVVVASAFLISLIAIFSIVISTRKKKKEASYPHYLPPKSFTVQTDGFLCGQHQNSTGFSGPTNFSYGSQVVPRSPRSSYGCASQKGSMYTEPDSDVLGASTTSINYEQVTEITNGFPRQNIIGEGGFGSVYKGYMPDGKMVAVKQLKAGSGQGDREFKAEVEIISRVHHRHLVSLVGYCISENQRLLIYEFVPNKTLEHHLHSKGLQALDWTKRLKIAIGSAKGLAYLHEDCHPKIIHRDIKSANILLDDDFEAQVADFGLARMNDTTQTHVSTRVMGTFGYLAPEYASSGKLTDRSDVFSFGVVLLELITGRKPVDPTQPLGDESLVEWARPLLVRALETGDVSQLVDPQLQNHYVESELFRMIETAAACVRHSAPKRPRMVQVVRSLDSEGELNDLSNGVKYGQSTVYDSGQYNEDIIKFRKMALGGLDSSEFDGFSGDYTSRDSHGTQSSSEYTSGESETRVMTQHGGGNISQRKYGGY